MPENLSPRKEVMEMDELMPEVIQAVPGPDYTIYAYFNDGTVHHFDMRPLIEKHTDSVFSPLADITVFTNALTVINGTAAWDLSGDRNPEKCIDLDPFTLHDSPKVQDPLAE